MKAIFSLVLLLLGLAKLADAQQFIERIYLKDSSYYEGYIIEQVPQQYLRIDRIKQKDTLTVPMTLIWKITKTYQNSGPAATKPSGKSEKPRYLKTAFLELLGNSVVYSLNFDMRTEKGRRDGWGFRVGYSSLAFNTFNKTSANNVNVSFVSIPFGINYLFGRKKGFLELGAGATYFSVKANGQLVNNDDAENYESEIVKLKLGGIIGSFNIGYRHMPYKKGIMYRFVLTPLYVDNSLLPLIGLSVGYKF